MTTGDGGMLVVRNPSLLEGAKKFRWFGLVKGAARTEVDVSTLGYKYNMNNVTATIGRVQLKTIDSLLERYKDHGSFYDSAFSNSGSVEFARIEKCASSSYWLYTLLSDNSAELAIALNSVGVSASKLHRPNNLHSIFGASNNVILPGLDRFYKRLLHIPCGWWVSSEDREKICRVILNA